MYGRPFFRRFAAIATLAFATVCSSSAAVAGDGKPVAQNAIHQQASRAKIKLSPQATTSANVLYFIDYSLGTDSFAMALSSLGISPTTTNDASEFNTLLQAGGWDLVIALQRNYPSASLYASSLGAYVAAGGKAIYSDWTADATVLGSFGAAATGSLNFLSISPGGSAIWSTLPSPVALLNPGWGIYATGLSPIGDGVVDGTYENGDAAVIVANAGRTIINGTLQDSYNDPNQGIQIAINEIGYLLTPPVTSALKGTIVGQSGKASVKCLNETSGQNVSVKTKKSFDCVAAGLAVSPGQTFTVTVKGTVK